MKPEEITIALTVFDRRAYLEQAVSAALGQTLPVRVVVVEDCGPDATLQPFILSKFGSRLTYYRNTQRRGLFDNLNACIDLCETPWLCICPDDDFLEPCFVEAMIELAQNLPDKGLYFGKANLVDEAGRFIDICEPDDVDGLAQARPVAEAARRMKRPAGSGEFRGQEADPLSVALMNPIRFPALLFRTDYAKAQGGFYAASLFAGDWELWAKLAVRYGAARTDRVAGNARSHDAAGRGTTRVERNGKFFALVNMQCKKNLALLRGQGFSVRLDPSAYRRICRIPSRYLLKYGAGWSPRMLRYNVGVLLQGSSPGNLHFLFQTCARLFGPRFVKTASALSRLFSSRKTNGG